MQGFISKNYQGGQKWNVADFWGAMYKEVYFAHFILEGSGGMLPQKILKFRPSEITSSAFSSKFTLPMVCSYYTLLTMQPCIKKKFQGGGGRMPPPP